MRHITPETKAAQQAREQSFKKLHTSIAQSLTRYGKEVEKLGEGEKNDLKGKLLAEIKGHFSTAMGELKITVGFPKSDPNIALVGIQRKENDMKTIEVNLLSYSDELEEISQEAEKVIGKMGEFHNTILEAASEIDKIVEQQQSHSQRSLLQKAIEGLAEGILMSGAGVLSAGAGFVLAAGALTIAAPVLLVIPGVLPAIALATTIVGGIAGGAAMHNIRSTDEYKAASQEYANILLGTATQIKRFAENAQAQEAPAQSM